MAKYRFKAHYNDGTTFVEDPKDPYANYSNINRNKLEAFELFDIDNNQTAIKIKFLPGQRLVWRRRKALVAGRGEITVHIIGKQQTINGRNVQGVALLYPDGTTEFFEKFNSGHPWLRPIDLLPEEK
jgi:hypothetical protein